MINICLDTSVLVKWFYPEEDSDKSHLLLRLSEELAVGLVDPDIVTIELANSLLAGKKFDIVDTKSSIKKLFSLEPNLVSINESFAGKAIDIAYKHGVTTYDSLFIALSELRNIPLFTADYKHHKKSISKNIVWLKEWKGNF